MASGSTSSGELYFVGERDPRTQVDTAYVKIGIVRAAENRNSEYRVKEHQTGNPRQLYLVQVFETPVVEQVETLLHGVYAPQRLSGEWFFFSEEERATAIDSATQFVAEARESEEQIHKADELRSQVSNGSIRPATDEVIAAHGRLLVVRGRLALLGKMLKTIDETIRKCHERGASIDRYANLNDGVERETFDEAAFKEAHPDMWAEYLVQTPRMNQRFIVTETKEMKAGIVNSLTEFRVIEGQVNHLSGEAVDETGLARLHDQYLRLISMQAPLEWEEKLLESLLKSECDLYDAIAGICSWSRRMENRMVLNKRALGEAQPAVFKRYASIVKSKPKLSIHRDRNFAH